MVILPNNVAVIAGDTHHAQWCAEQGLVHDKWMADTITGIIKKRCINLAVDGGANIGTLTAPMLKAGAKVWAFEPNPEAVECLRHNCPGAHVVCGALGDKRGVVPFSRQANAGASSVVLPEDITPNDIDVPVETLDSHRLRPGLIKLDVEGYEVRALEGARNTIALTRPVIVCEINSGALGRLGYTPQDVFSFLAEFRYRWGILQPDCKPGDPQYDIVAYPR